MRDLVERGECTAEGKTSFDDWPMFTWSFGWTSSPASAAITSFAFMFELRARAGLEDVDRELVVELAGGDAVAGRRRCARPCRASSSPSSAFTRAAAALMRPSQCATATRDRLAGDREVVDRLGGLAAPELLPFRRPLIAPSLAPSDGIGQRGSDRPRAASSSSQLASFTRGRPVRLAARALGRVDRLPARVRRRPRRRAPRAASSIAAASAARGSRPARASSSRSSTVSVASFLFVPITPRRAALDPAAQ